MEPTKMCVRCKRQPAKYLVTMKVSGRVEALCGRCDSRYQYWCAMNGVIGSKEYKVIQEVTA